MELDVRATSAPMLGCNGHSVFGEGCGGLRRTEDAYAVSSGRVSFIYLLQVEFEVVSPTPGDSADVCSIVVSSTNFKSAP